MRWVEAAADRSGDRLINSLQRESEEDDRLFPPPAKRRFIYSQRKSIKSHFILVAMAPGSLFMSPWTSSVKETQSSSVQFSLCLRTVKRKQKSDREDEFTWVTNNDDDTPLIIWEPQCEEIIFWASYSVKTVILLKRLYSQIKNWWRLHDC